MTQNMSLKKEEIHIYSLKPTKLAYHVVPEYSANIILAILMLLTILTIILRAKRQQSTP